MIIISWIILSILVGILANKKNRSGIGYTFLSLLLSPFIGLLVVLILGESEKKTTEKISMSTIEKNDDKSITSSYHNETYVIKIRNYSDNDFIKIKKDLMEQYENEGYTKIVTNKDNHWTLKHSINSKGYIQILLQNNTMNIEAFKVKTEPIISNIKNTKQKEIINTDKLIELSRMLDKGLITEDEFLKHKNNLV